VSVLARSVGNAFRNKVRTAAVVAVLAVAIGLALAMLVANQAVGAKVQELNASVGTVLTVNPAGGQGFEGGGEILIDAEGPDSPETFSGDTIDVGALAEQFFGLAIDPYPRKQGASLSAGGEAEPAENEFQQKLRSLLGKS